MHLVEWTLPTLDLRVLSADWPSIGAQASEELMWSWQECLRENVGGANAIGAKEAWFADDGVPRNHIPNRGANQEPVRLDHSLRRSSLSIAVRK